MIGVRVPDHTKGTNLHMRFKQRTLAFTSASVIALGLTAVMSTAAHAATCTASLGGSCGAYAYNPPNPMSNGFNTYVEDQGVGANSGTTQTINVTDPSSWSATSNAVPYGYTGVQTFPADQQLMGDWCASGGWQPQAGCSTQTGYTPITGVSSLTESYTENSPRNTADPNVIDEFAAETWPHNYSDDIMFWVDTQGRCDTGAYGDTILAAAVNIDGQTWTLNRYGAAGGELIWVLDANPSVPDSCAAQTSGTVDIYAAYQWMMANGVISSTTQGWDEIDAGWEITSADNQQFNVTSWQITGTVAGQTQPPVVTTSPATSVTTTGATLNGTVNPEGQPATYQYQYGTTTAYGNTIPATAASAGSGTTAVSEPQPVTGLTPGTVYHYRLTASNATGTTNGADQTFTTNTTASAPVVTTNPATNITSSGATLNGTVNPEGQATTYQLDYGTTTAYGTSVPSPAGSAGSGTTAVNENQAVTGLTPNTVYHYRVEAANATGTTFGADQTFTTSAATSLILGDSTVEASVDSNVQGQAQAVQYTANRTSTSQTFSFYVDPSSTATAGVLGEYTNSGTDPGTLLKQVTFTPKPGWNTITFTGVSEVSGTKYWLAELGTSGVLAFRDQGTGAYSPGSTSTTLTALPATWSTGQAWHGGLMSAYISG